MLMDVTEKPKAYAPKDAARLLGLSERKLDELIATRALKSFKVGKSRRISSDAIDQFIKEREKAAR